MWEVKAKVLPVEAWAFETLPLRLKDNLKAKRVVDLHAICGGPGFALEHNPR